MCKLPKFISYQYSWLSLQNFVILEGELSLAETQVAAGKATISLKKNQNILKRTYEQQKVSAKQKYTNSSFSKAFSSKYI